MTDSCTNNEASLGRRIADRLGGRARHSLLVAMLGCAPLAQAAPTANVFAAASLTDAMDAAIEHYEAHHEVDIVPVYLSSSTAARQIANGAPADLYFSANQKWMDWLMEQGITIEARVDLLQNRLSLIAPNHSEVQAFTPGEADASLSSLLADERRLSVGDPEHVPAGIYAKQALQSLGEWKALASRLASANDVRAALALVARGETPLGIVYQTDASASDRVRQLGLFPIDSHTPITYPVALVNTPTGDAASAFRDWLESDESMQIFTSLGFSPVVDDAGQ